MEARAIDEIPAGEVWQYEPKWDGFRCIAFRDGQKVYLQSKTGQPLARYFPDIADALAKLATSNFVLDGELAIPVGGKLSFDELQLHLHPAASLHRLRSTRARSTVVFERAVGGAAETIREIRARKFKIDEKHPAVTCYDQSHHRPKMVR
jgi:ATP-dependent DNA ligase